MSLLITLVNGFAGKPSHAPLTDASIGAYIKQDVSIANALIPGRLEETDTHAAGSGGRTDWTGWSSMAEPRPTSVPDRDQPAERT